MNSSSFSKLLLPMAIILGAIGLAIDILTSGGNALGKVYFYLMIGSALFGLLAPKGGFYYLVCLTAYLDYFKRLMILDSGMSMQDLYYVLGMAPATICGIMASLVYAALQGRVQMARGQGTKTAIILAAVIAATAVTVVSASSGKGRAMGDAVNTFIYALLLFVVPLLFPTPQDLALMLRRILYIFIPAGLYMIYHGIFGITSWEMAYVKSGFTIEIRMLAESIFRPFGTMSSAAAASSILSIFVVLALYGPWGKTDSKFRPSGSPGAFLRSIGTLIFLAAAICTLTRTGWVSGIIALVAAVIFRFKALTVAFYSVTIGLTLTLILSAGTMLENKSLFRATDWLTGGDHSSARGMALRVTTFTERLQSFQNLLENKRIWTPFGWKMAGRATNGNTGVVHDAISDALISYGYIPVVFLFILGAWSIKQMHRAIANSASPLEFRLNTVSAGCLIGTLAGCFSVWSQIRLFPVNFYLWLFPSVIFAVAMHRRREESSGQQPGAEGSTETRIPIRRTPGGWATPQHVPTPSR